ncbi:hypothetical protein BGX27_006565 [Mortierella sp. AM989]|nr:hypothetical protein BGX27_006565 [Mortierella sp. AM989]
MSKADFMTDRISVSELNTSTTSTATATSNNASKQEFQQSQQLHQQSSIFLKKKKPTVASIGSKPLLRPFNNKFIDYNNPGKHDPAPLKPTKGTPISLPGLTSEASPSTNSSSPATDSSSSFITTAASVPFTFDNHTQESKTVAQNGTKIPANKASSLGKRSLATGGNAASSGANSDAFTILRIKRKRHEEPLDTLVVQEQMEKLTGKKQKKIEDSIQQERDNTQAGEVSLPKSPAVFRLATTVNKQSFKDPTQSIQLRDKITHLAETKRPRSRMSERIQDLESYAQKNRAELTEKMQKDARSARFRVINQNRAGMANSERPPQVKSSVEAEAEAALDVFKMYDAVREDLPKSKRRPRQTDEEESDIMCNFLPMVREYLSISEKTPEPRITTTASDSGERSTTPLSDRRRFDEDSEFDDSEDEYVYDIYYRDLHADHQQESKHRAIGALLWFSDDENNFMNEDDSSDDDYEDSDSNAEDYYQNDYPEDELSEGDNPYELSDTDEDYIY